MANIEKFLNSLPFIPVYVTFGDDFVFDQLSMLVIFVK